MTCENAFIDGHRMAASNQKGAQRLNQLLQNAFRHGARSFYFHVERSKRTGGIDND
jgi:hypothetical protein